MKVSPEVQTNSKNPHIWLSLLCVTGKSVVRGEMIDETLRKQVELRGWKKEQNGPRWLHPSGGILPLL